MLKHGELNPVDAEGRLDHAGCVGDGMLGDGLFLADEGFLRGFVFFAVDGEYRLAWGKK